MRKFILAVAVLGAWVETAAAIGREDVLECGVADGSKFILRSKYEGSMIPLPALHSSRETKRESWGAAYQDRPGKLTPIPASVQFAGRRQVGEVCANFGMKNGAPLAPFIYRRPDGNWSRQEDFDERLSISVSRLPAGSPVQRQMAAAGITDAAYRFGWVYPDGQRLVYEQPLYRRTGIHSTPIDAVYQAFSSDGGKTWSEGTVTTDAHIFELGKSLVEQSISARPLSLNGKNLP
jgi:hypothetical protein